MTVNSVLDPDWHLIFILIILAQDWTIRQYWHFSNGVSLLMVTLEFKFLCHLKLSHIMQFYPLY